MYIEKNKALHKSNLWPIAKELRVFLIVGTFVLFDTLTTGWYLSFNFLKGILFYWGIYNFYRIIRYRKDREWRLLRIALWSVLVLILSIAKHNGNKDFRREADRVVSYVNEYTAINSHCPAEIDDSFYAETDKEIKRLIRYGCNKDGKPFLYYSGRSFLYDKYRYNFESGEWKYSIE